MGRRSCSMAQLLLLGCLAVTAAVPAAEPTIRGATTSSGSRFISYNEVLAVKASQAAAAAAGAQAQQQTGSAAAAPVPDSAGIKPAPVQEQQQKPAANKPASDLLSGLVAPNNAAKKPTAAAVGQQPAAAEAPKPAEQKQPAAPSQPAAADHKQEQQQQRQKRPRPAGQPPHTRDKAAADVKQPGAQHKPAADVDKSAPKAPQTPSTLPPAAQPKLEPVAEKPAPPKVLQTQQPAAQPKPESPVAAVVPATQRIPIIPDCTTGDCCQDRKFKPKTTQCRAATHPCDEPEFCTGSSATCPEDDGKSKPDGTTCAWQPTSNPTMGRFMADTSKLQGSAVSLQAALALMPMVASTLAYGSSSRDAGLQQCTGKCHQGLCSVDFDILHCCVAKQHYLHKRREEAYDHHHSRGYPEPESPEIYSSKQYHKTREIYGPDFDAYTDAAARHPDSRQSRRHGPEMVKATTSRTRLMVDDPYGAEYVANDIHQYQELYQELHDAEEQISLVLRRKYQDLEGLEQEEQDKPHKGADVDKDGAPYMPKVAVGEEDSPHSYGKEREEGEEGASYAPWWEAEHPADGGRAYCWQ